MPPFWLQLYERLDSEGLPAALHRGRLSDAKWRKARAPLIPRKLVCGQWLATTQRNR